MVDDACGVPAQRLRIDLAYDGTLFHGWATQPGLRTVQGELQEALSLILRQPVALTVAGRTDAGVHAEAQVAHFDVAEPGVTRALPDLRGGTLRRLTARLNGLLSANYTRVLRPVAERPYIPRGYLAKGESDLTVASITPVSSAFDARFSALGRAYRYTLADGGSTLNPLDRRGQWWAGGPALDLSRMQEAAAELLGEHDYLSFCKPRDGATTTRTLRQLEIGRGHGGLIHVWVAADAFCHSMVRSLVGSLTEVGRGRRDVAWIRSLLCDPSRAHNVPVAPARGLTLVAVEYPSPEEWAARAAQARNRRC